MLVYTYGVLSWIGRCKSGRWEFHGPYMLQHEDVRLFRFKKLTLWVNNFDGITNQETFNICLSEFLHYTSRIYPNEIKPTEMKTRWKLENKNKVSKWEKKKKQTNKTERYSKSNTWSKVKSRQLMEDGICWHRTRVGMGKMNYVWDWWALKYLYSFLRLVLLVATGGQLSMYWSVEYLS